MGEHQTWFDLLRHNDWFRHQFHSAQEALGIHTVPLLGGNSHFTLNHVFVSALISFFIIWGALSFRRATAKGGDAALIPPAKWTLRNFFEIACDSIFNLMVGVFGNEKDARKFFPLIASLALFILFNNLMALIPGFAPGTDTLKTNLLLGLIVFFATHIYGLQANGIGYLKHFMGPMIWLAPLMLPIEIISHIARPLSLALRLMGNMAADHKVLFTFFTLVPLFVPIPFYFLGMLVCVVQALVFSLLAMVYISMAIAHDH